MNRHFSPTYSGLPIPPVTHAPAQAGSAGPQPLLLSALIAATLLVAWHLRASAETYTVCPSGCGYTTIQAAVDAVPSQLTQPVTIQVSAGTYRERVQVTNKKGTASNTLLIQAQGVVTIDGSDPYPEALWTLYNTGPVYWATYAATSAMSPPNSQVFVNGVRYKYVSGSSYGALPDSCYGYDAAADRVYVHAGGINPGSVLTFIGNHDRMFGFDVHFSNYLTIDGFIVLRNDEQGINIRGTVGSIDVQSVTVKNCTSAQNWNQGIFVRNCSGCSIEQNTTHTNVKDGIYLINSDNCQITDNVSHGNENPAPGRDGVVGIKVGDSASDVTNVTMVTVDDNVVHDNEDTGIECHGATQILLRRNVSYHNRDHGYDNSNADQIAWLNNIAARNDHDGMSIENDAQNVWMYNCILWHNALNPFTLGGGNGGVRELFVDNATGFASDYNLIAGLNPETWNNGSSYRRLVEYRPLNSQTHWKIVTFMGYRDSAQVDFHSYSSNPMFIDSAGTYAVSDAASEVVDRGRANLTGWSTPFWLDTDPRGFSPHDVAGVANAGSGTPAYADIGAFEFDVPPAAISNLGFDPDPDDCTKFWLTWTAPSDDVNLPASAPGTQYEMKGSSQSFSDWTAGTGSPLGLTPAQPPTVQTLQVGVGPGQRRWLGIKTKDSNGLWSGASNVVDISGPPLPFSDCSEGGGTYAVGGDGGGGYRARPLAGPAGEESAVATGFAENTLLNGVAKGSRATDLFRLPALTASGGKAYSVRIREASGHAVALDRVRLLTVDHSSSVRTFMASGKPVLGTRMAPMHAEDASGRDVTTRVDGSTTDAFKGDSGAVLTVKLATEPADSADPLVIEASGLGWSSSGILVQVPDEASGWRTVGRVQPRLYFDELAVDSIASTQVRLYFLGRHYVRFVGRVVRSSEPPTLQWAQLLKADAARVGDALAAVTSADTTALALAGPDTLRLAFASPPLAADQVRECYLAVDATPPALASPLASLSGARAVPSLPARFALGQNQPNPFSVSTMVRFDLPVGAMVRLEVFDAQGRRVEVLANSYFPAGEHVVQWNPSASQSRIGPGVYFYRLEAGSFRDRKKMAVLP